jgi:hypothetical protein
MWFWRSRRPVRRCADDRAIERTPDASLESLDLVTKINPIQGLARTLIPWVIQHREIALDRPFCEYRSASESNEIAQREQQVYLFAERTPELRRVMPRCYRAGTDAVRDEHALFLEFIPDAARLDASGALADSPARCDRRGVDCGCLLAGRVGRPFPSRCPP